MWHNDGHILDRLYNDGDYSENILFTHKVYQFILWKYFCSGFALNSIFLNNMTKDSDVYKCISALHEGLRTIRKIISTSELNSNNTLTWCEWMWQRDEVFLYALAYVRVYPTRSVSIESFAFAKDSMYEQMH